MTMADICREIGVGRDGVSAVVSRMKAAGEIHIQEYTYDDESGRRYPRAVYAWGPRADAKKPRANKNAVGMRAQKVAHKRIQTSSVFNLALTRRQCRAMRRAASEASSGKDQQQG
jgi:hypothetical protein